MVRSNMGGLRRSFGLHALERVTTFECYFLRLPEPAGSRKKEDVLKHCAIFNKNNEDLENFNEEDN